MCAFLLCVGVCRHAVHDWRAGRGPCACMRACAGCGRGQCCVCDAALGARARVSHWVGVLAPPHVQFTQATVVLEFYKRVCDRLRHPVRCPTCEKRFTYAVSCACVCAPPPTHAPTPVVSARRSCCPRATRACNRRAQGALTKHTAREHAAGARFPCDSCSQTFRCGRAAGGLRTRFWFDCAAVRALWCSSCVRILLLLWIPSRACADLPWVALLCVVFFRIHCATGSGCSVRTPCRRAVMCVRAQVQVEARCARAKGALRCARCFSLRARCSACASVLIFGLMRRRWCTGERPFVCEHPGCGQVSTRPALLLRV